MPLKSPQRKGAFAISRSLVAVGLVALAAAAALLYQSAISIRTPSRSGPISTFPASWICSDGAFSAPSNISSGSRTTTNELSGIVYPDLWNTTTRVSLVDVYATIIHSPAFVNVSSGDGWVTTSWWFDSAIEHDIHGEFILTNGTSPVGYVSVSYDILNSKVTIDQYQKELVCT